MENVLGRPPRPGLQRRREPLRGRSGVGGAATGRRRWCGVTRPRSTGRRRDREEPTPQRGRRRDPVPGRRARLPGPGVAAPTPGRPTDQGHLTSAAATRGRLARTGFRTRRDVVLPATSLRGGRRLLHREPSEEHEGVGDVAGRRQSMSHVGAAGGPTRCLHHVRRSAHASSTVGVRRRVSCKLFHLTRQIRVFVANPYPQTVEVLCPATDRLLDFLQ